MELGATFEHDDRLTGAGQTTRHDRTAVPGADDDDLLVGPQVLTGEESRARCWLITWLCSRFRRTGHVAPPVVARQWSAMCSMLNEQTCAAGADVGAQPRVRTVAQPVLLAIDDDAAASGDVER